QPGRYFRSADVDSQKQIFVARHQSSQNSFEPICCPPSAVIHLRKLLVEPVPWLELRKAIPSASRRRRSTELAPVPVSPRHSALPSKSFSAISERTRSRT